MKINQNIVLFGTKVILVPYRQLQKYHEWMQDVTLREATASEPLTLEEEYEMQRKWAEDEDKLTFIILARQYHSAPRSGEERESRMIGDVNMFLADGFEGDAECEIMIAGNLSYITTRLNIRPIQLIARIGNTNQASIRLFQTLGFDIERVVDVFDQVDLR
ncbi:hypothetical protein TREMEDRAFT_18845, partial [Tremella mesenterica DSM 1558]|uniref:uncharacterized protein n=1 Tax=Tremella mesenterica (strain ATCC 24925 / CBS 8224 / DSM 1558 / NBRC 9311 / NRRL Y-6157 / RJB 2259-6 / UBC 559-6) TaxID=578456 RepID=UPI0003F49B0B